MQRPTSLTVIGWVLIVFGAFGLLGTMMLPANPVAAELMKQSPLPMSAHVAIGAIGALISIACGVGVLKGLGWSRLLYTAWVLISVVIALVSMPFSSLMVVGWLLQAVIIFFLFRPEAGAWFSRGPARASE
jgi:hypothetical protein